MDWLIGVVPVALVVLMCPLMMIFMMRGRATQGLAG